MKYCPQCQKQFTENWITFCSEDGTILIDTGYTPSQQPPPPGTQRPVYTPPGAEHQNWRSPDPNAPGNWEGQDQWRPAPAPVWQPPPPPSAYGKPQPNVGLALASMITGIVGMAAGMCLGPIPGIAALILGLIALSQIKNAPDRVGGKPFAVVGIITGSLGIAFWGLWILLAIIGGIMS